MPEGLSKQLHTSGALGEGGTLHERGPRKPKLISTGVNALLQHLTSFSLGWGEEHLLQLCVELLNLLRRAGAGPQINGHFFFFFF